MGFSIAVAGKGGTGKTSISCLIIRYLLKNGKGPVLAIDADPNANLGEGLGLEINNTIGSIIASFNDDKINIPPGMTKEAYLEIKLNGAITESKGLDLITMGRGEGAECYCYPNTLLRKFADTLSGNYAYTIMDNEAGMEHLSRRTTHDIDMLLIVSDHSVKGVRTIARIRDLAEELKLVVGTKKIIINGVSGELAPMVKEELDKYGLEQPVVIPDDENIYQFDLEARPLVELPDDSKAVMAVDNLMDEIASLNKMKNRV